MSVDFSFLDEPSRAEQKKNAPRRPRGRPKGSKNKKTIARDTKKAQRAKRKEWITAIEDAKRDDPNYEFDIDHMATEFHGGGMVLSVGKSKRGKTYNTNYLLQYFTLQNPVFKGGMVFQGSKGMNDDYAWMPDSHVIDGYNEDVLRAWVDKLKTIRGHVGDEMPATFLIFDDLLNAVQTNAYFNNFISLYRHLNISIFMNVQSLANRTSSTLVREQTNFAFFYKTSAKNTLKHMYEWFGQQWDNEKEFYEHFHKTTHDKHCAMLIDTSNDGKRGNFVQWKAPPDFKAVKLNFDNEKK